jgi:N-acetylmuramoyl-L-alanine amidase
MRWSKASGAERISRQKTVFPLLASASALLLLSGLLLRGAPSEKQISIYSRRANYSLPVMDHGGQGYVGLLETLEPLGSVNARSNGSKWKFSYNGMDSEFVNGKKRARINGRDWDLPANFVLENGRGLVPLSSLSTLLPQFLGGAVAFHENSRRLFVGDVAVHFTAQVNKSATPALVMNFTSPVNPSISTEPGRLKMVFSHEPLVPPGSQTLTFDSKAIPSATYSENNGTAEVDVVGSVPLFASFSNDGKTITISSAAQLSGQAQVAQAGAASTAAGTSVAAEKPAPSRYFAVVDASHGGDERGAALTDQISEKDVTLAFARRLRTELETRGMPTLLLRDGDNSLSLDQRANLTNSTHPAIYISVHATSQGTGVRLYTAMVPNIGQGRGPFLDWDTAQSAFLSASQKAESSVAAEFGRRQVAVRMLGAPLRPLNNVIAAAIAIEVAPSADGVSSFMLPAYQEVVAASVATGIGATRGALEAGR